MASVPLHQFQNKREVVFSRHINAHQTSSLFRLGTRYHSDIQARGIMSSQRLFWGPPYVPGQVPLSPHIITVKLITVPTLQMRNVNLERCNHLPQVDAASSIPFLQATGPSALLPKKLPPLHGTVLCPYMSFRFPWRWETPKREASLSAARTQALGSVSDAFRIPGT